MDKNKQSVVTQKTYTVYKNASEARREANSPVCLLVTLHKANIGRHTRCAWQYI